MRHARSMILPHPPTILDRREVQSGNTSARRFRHVEPFFF
jgi:hypothetical protein